VLLTCPPSQQYSMPDMDGNYSSDASPNKGRSKSQPRMRGEKSTSPSRKQDLLKIVPPKLISNDELEERKSQRVARDLRESTKIFAHANEQRNSIRCESATFCSCSTSRLHIVLTLSLSDNRLRQTLTAASFSVISRERKCWLRGAASLSARRF
jgi:hypothetical protein